MVLSLIRKSFLRLCRGVRAVLVTRSHLAWDADAFGGKSQPCRSLAVPAVDVVVAHRSEDAEYALAWHKNALRQP